MDILQAFIMGEANRGKEMKVFDWVKAAELIKAHNPDIAEAGLAEDWYATGGEIFARGEIIPEDKTYVYLTSTWATPVLRLDGQEFDCWKKESELPNYEQESYWPKNAMAILDPK